MNILTKNKHSPIVPRNIEEPNDNTVLWRYIDFQQLYSILEMKELTLTHPSKFDDLLEGAFTKHDENLHIDMILNAEIKSAEDKIGSLFFLQEDAFPQIANSLYISCWHENHTESTLMWKIYSSMHKGIAIKTTYQQLKNSFNQDFFIGKIRYVNNNTELPTNQIFRLFYKREEYKNENEIRIIYVNKETMINSQAKLENEYFYHKIHNGHFINEIILSPYSNMPFIQSVLSLSIKHDIKCDLSSLVENPKKIKGLLYKVCVLLSKVADKNCSSCTGKGYTTKNPNNDGFSFNFCKLCNIDQKWNEIKNNIRNGL